MMKDSITSEQELRDYLGEPSINATSKVIPYIDEHVEAYIAKSPFLTMSTADENGVCDASPRGDAPGFVLVQDEKHLLIPERPGNKRADSLMNILKNPGIGLLFMIPGLGETLRINGKARLVKDAEWLEKMAVQGKAPLLAIQVEVEECYIHCAKAFIRSGLWKPDSWLEKEDLPKPSKILHAHTKLPDTTPDSIQKRLEEGYRERLY
ncbi:pyridoxamine 5'-phosphate oxidase family protein [Jeotgalibacillus sp. R-1-5s-1]|uniref:pyridoxamine 5'-phosphate oxidase family protein n=1 Tax=Jeotgalibacillus sp. R-1-5s-1 TaxID=2555897 RepID=UPI00106AA974|nr:pyridoxamine 5'-phosphate oxidase family protein [Jeotgalibacillus sp. R-1-5s-1]TFD94543.1 pyridoxamine 5'-phosphate oxidase family protein [Jeotgalibacillus sp. R-1-5s-1]